MKWHQGSIPEAINQAKLNRTIFLVFVSGSDEQSQKMNETLEDVSICERLDEKCVALKLEANSDSAKQFSQIYPVVIVPSTFFIGVNGVPLEVIGGSLESSPLLEKIEKVIQLHENTGSAEINSSELLSKDVGNDTSTASAVVGAEFVHAVPAESPASPTNASIEDTSVASDINKIPDSEEQHQIPSTLTNTDNEPSALPLEERVERAKKLTKQLQERKQIEEKEKEKQKELERRNMGKAVQKNKQKQQEQEFKQLAEELAREKAEERAVVEKIRQQIARDRAERAAKFNAAKAEEERQKQERLQAKLKEEQERAAIESANRSVYARLQFKLPDGSSVNHQFDAGASLQTVLDFVKETVRPQFSFHLALAFPRREFQGSDYSQTLRDLQLAPSASVLVLPVRSAAVSSDTFKTFNFVWFLLSPFLTIWRMLQSFIFGTPSPTFPSSANSSSTGASSHHSSSTSEKGQHVTPERKSHSADSSSFGRREGNIYRLPTSNGEDDDNNTWNGNSTQQQ